MTTCDSVDRNGPRLLRAALVVSTALCSGLATPSWAQSGVSVDTVDENGINMSTLNYTERSEDVAIGAGEFPSRLSYSRGPGNQVAAHLSGANNVTGRLTSGLSEVFLNIGGVSRRFWVYGTDPNRFSSGNGTPGYIIRSNESGNVVFTYFSSSGEELRFVVSDATACGRYNSQVGVANIQCTRISRWTAPNNVVANFSYNVRSELLGSFNETDLASVSNTLNLSLSFGYTRYKDNGNYTGPAFGVTSIVASSNQAGACNVQPHCSRTASYQYDVRPQQNPNILGFETTIILKSFTNTLQQTTQYLRSTPLNQNVTWQSIRRPENPTVDAIKVVYGVYQYPTGYPSAQVSDALGNNWTYTRDPTNQYVTTRTDPLGKSRVYVFDGDWKLIRFRDEMQKETHWQYYAQGFPPTKEIRPDLDSTEWEYDNRGNVTKTTIKANSAGPATDIVTRASFPVSCDNPKTCNKPITTTDAREQVTDYTYDPAHGGVLTVTAPAPALGKPRPQTRYNYGTVAGASTLTGTSECRTSTSCAGTADERKVTLGYGANGLLPTSKTEQSGDGAIQSSVAYGYDALGNVTSEDGPLAGSADTSLRAYDRAGKLVSTIAPDPDGANPQARVAYRYTYDAGGRQTREELGTVPSQATDLTSFTALHALDTVYDLNGNKTKETFLRYTTVVRRLTQYSYDAAGQLDCTALRMNSAEFGSLPASACTPSMTGSAGPDRITKYGYDDAGRVNKVTVGFGTSSQIDEVTRVYGGNGQLASITDAKGNTTTYGYDGFVRLRTTTYPGGSYEEIGYDPAGSVISRRSRDGQTVAFGYDALNRVTSVDRPNAVPGETDRSYAYDNFGLLTQAQDSAGRVLVFLYDALGRKTSQSDNAHSMGNASYRYDSAGRRTRFTWGDGNYVSYDYRNSSELSAIRDSAGNALVTFSYDELGRRTGIGRANGSQTTMVYNGGSQLAQLAQDLAGTAYDLTRDFAYNGGAGQIITRASSNNAYIWTDHFPGTRTYDVNALNQITRAGNTNIGYDARGNLTSSGSDTYAFTADNRPVTAKGVALTDDPLDRLSGGVLDTNGPNTLLLYDGPDVIAEVDRTSGGVLRRYIHGSGDDEPLVWYEGANLLSPRWLHADERGSVIAVTDSGGNAIQINSYDEFGIPGANNAGRFQYTGQKWLPNIGVYDFKARFYSPSLGRFMQTDPIGYADGMNWYNYVDGDPVNRTDPSGLQAYDCAGNGADLCYSYPGEQPNPKPGYVWYPQFDYGAQWDFGGHSALLELYKNSPINQRRSTAPNEDTKYLTNAACSHWGPTLTGIGDGLVHAGGAMAAIGGAVAIGGMALGTISGATGNLAGALVATAIVPPATGMALLGGGIQAAGAVISFAGGTSTRQLVKNASDAVIDRIPKLPGAAKWSGKKLVDQLADRYVPDIRVCRGSWK